MSNRKQKSIDTLKAKLMTVPAEPGVYIFRDSLRRVIYVGKARSLQERVRSYFQSSGLLKNEALKEEISDFDVVVCSSEIEALILESNLIKKYKPRFNVMLKDDKSYPYIAVFISEEFPKVVLTRGVRAKGVKYFGPYVSVKAARNTLRMLQKVFPLRHCKGAKPGGRMSPCLSYEMKMCMGPCTGKVKPEDYRKYVEKFIAFLEGKYTETIDSLESRMKQAAQKQEFEEAARIRNQLEAAQKVLAHAGYSSAPSENYDLIGISKDDLQACFLVSQRRSGINLGNLIFFSDIEGNSEECDLINEFLKRYYSDVSLPPSQVYVPQEPREKELIENWLHAGENKKVQIKVPAKGKKKREMELATRNAEIALEGKKFTRARDLERIEKALEELKESLFLVRYPLRMECFDISTFGGGISVGSMVVFKDGLPQRGNYRRFKIKYISGIDDVAMMREILSRRLKRYAKQTSEEENANGFSEKPDLIIVDGGKGQLSAALDVLRILGIEDIDVAALSKRLEEVHRPGLSEPILLPRNSEALFLLQRLRDEAHRFAITYSRSLVMKDTKESWLDGVRGIGPERKKKLIRHFGSPEAVANADILEIQSIPGIPKNVAKSIFEAARNLTGKRELAIANSKRED
ncbi:MAG: excinuclease ABC subunit UvrC [Actinomycetota bacterium]|nr:excinuclease ABC subunit UvrC [Actinomycetota bacterium]